MDDDDDAIITDWGIFDALFKSRSTTLSRYQILNILIDPFGDFLTPLNSTSC